MLHILEAELAGQLAAGEAIDRPAAVARELIENALDAGARRITIALQAGGTNWLRVSDDGHGIAADEIGLVGTRHATSKLSSLDELTTIATHGFRGVALASIAAVSRLTLSSRTADAAAATELRLAGGTIQHHRMHAAPVGTSVTVEQLFYTMPQRRRFLHGAGTEAAAVVAVATHYALIVPQVAFCVVVDGRTMLATSGCGQVRAALAAIYGATVAGAMIDVAPGQHATPGAPQVRGLLAPPGYSRRGRDGIHLSLNRHAIAARGRLPAVIEAAYRGILAPGEHPIAVLDIAIDPADVDRLGRTMHRGIRLQAETFVAAAVFRASRAALAERRSVVLPLSPAPTAPVMVHAGATGWRPIGQYAGRFILAEAEQGLAIMDQRGADIGGRRAALLAQWRAGGPAAQPLSPALTLPLDERRLARLLAQAAALQRWGFAIAEFGPGVIVRRAPAGLTPAQVSRALSAISGADEPTTEAIALSIAEATAVEAGVALSPAECGAIVARWCASRGADESPAGPVVAWLTPARLGALIQQEALRHQPPGAASA
ncbi:MAG: DNA mismatch repair endonuclease MutL [Chloroflexi bacterium]|nr:DNA mismatch repair endonuclease MutL [Chloroflexota bacterium]